MKASRMSILVLTFGALLSGCYYEGDSYHQGYTNPPPQPTPAPVISTVSQYAFDASASSEGMPGQSDFSAAQALGAPDVNACADDPAAWSPLYSNPTPGTTAEGVTIDDFLDVGFAQYAWVRQVKIYETYAPGAIVRVDLEATDGSAAPLTIFEDYSGDGPAPCPSAFVISLDQPTYAQYDHVVVYLDENLVGDFNGDGSYQDDFNEIDAVEMIGDVED